LHQLVSVVDGPNGTISLFIDGALQQSSPLSYTTTENPPFDVVNTISGIGTDHFYLAKSDWSADPNWKGLMEKVSIYNAALTPDQVMYLFSKGAETKQTITVGAPSFIFDTTSPASTSTITGLNLTSPTISISCPVGITAQISGKVVTSIPSTSLNTEVTFVYDGKETVDGNIVLTSGLITNSIPVKAVSDVACYVPLYGGNITNIVPGDGAMNSLADFNNPDPTKPNWGWGSRTVVSLINDPADVYCGAASMKIGDPDLGSLDFHPGTVDNGGLLQANTTYRVKLMAKTTGIFNVGIERTDMNNTTGTNNKILHQFDTNGEWKTVDFYFTTGDQLDVDPVIYINAFNLSGTIAFVDNWEIYPTTDPLIFPTITSLAFDPQGESTTFNITSVNLQSDIAVTAPAGITIDQTVPANTTSTVYVSWDGTTAVTGNITLTSGTMTITIPVKTLSTSNATCFTPLYTDINHPNLIPDPYFNDKNQFHGWAHGNGTWGLITVADNPDSVYCGSNSAKLFISADIEVQLGGMLTTNSGYIARAMVRTFGGAFHMGINGEDTAIPGDLKDSIDTNGEWQQMTFKFNTGDAIAETPVIFFNNDGNSGKLAYLDNWELYQEDQLNALVPVKDQFTKLYVQNGKIVAEFDLDHNSQVQLAVYTVQGSMVSFDKIAGITGKNTKVVSAVLPAGVYMVKLIKDGQTSFRKLIL